MRNRTAESAVGDGERAVGDATIPGAGSRGGGREGRLMSGPFWPPAVIRCDNSSKHHCFRQNNAVAPAELAQILARGRKIVRLLGLPSRGNVSARRTRAGRSS